MRTVVVAAMLLGSLSPATAQPATSLAGGDKFGPVRQLLVDGYEIKTGFADQTGGAYLVLQKATSAYLCHSSPAQVCEKLN